LGKIAYVEKTWNVVTGCTPASPGCSRCYARNQHRRLRAMGQPKYQHAFEDVRFHNEELTRPVRWKEPRRIFLNSMSDTFHPAITDRQIAALWTVMRARERHTFVVVTKRIERAALLLPSLVDLDHPPVNIWLVVTCENQEWAERRIPVLLECPTAVHGVSLEPLLGPINLHPWLCAYGSAAHPEQRFGSCCRLRPGGIDWVIVGCESGTTRRPCDNAWAIDIASQCRAAGVAFFGKQFEVGRIVGGRPYHREWGTHVSRHPEDWRPELRHQMYPGDHW
jgi:protein gp37